MSDASDHYTLPISPHHAAMSLRVLLGIGALVVLIGGCIPVGH